MDHQQETASDPSVFRRSRLFTNLRWFGVFLTALVAFLFFRKERAELRIEAQNALTAIVDFKAEELIHWRKERLNDISFIEQSATGSHLIQQVATNTPKSQFPNWLKRMRGDDRYFEIRLYDTNFVLRHSLPALDEPLHPELRESLETCLFLGVTTRSVLHRHATNGLAHFDIVIPVLNPATNGRPASVSGMVSLSLNVEPFLIPLLKSWPASRVPGQTFLLGTQNRGIVSLDTNNVLTVSPQANPSVALAQPLGGSTNASSHAARPHQAGFITAYHSIPGTPWVIGARLSEAQVFAPLPGRTAAVVGTTLFVIFALSSTIKKRDDAREMRYLRAQISSQQRLNDSERELRKHAGRLRMLSCAIEQSPATVVITDRAGAIQYVNARFTELSGYTAGEVLGQNPRILNSGETPRETFDEMWATILAGRDWHGHFCNRKKSGEIYWESAVISPMTNEAGQIVNFIAIKEDITQQRQAEERLRESEEKFRQLAENVRDVFWVATASGNTIFYVSPGYEFIWGRPAAELYAAPRAWSSAIHADDRSRVLDALAVLATGGGLDEEYRIHRPDGSIRWIHHRAFPIQNDRGNGAPARIAAIAEDITDRKSAELELSRREERFRVLIENSSDVITVIDRAGVIEFQSPSVERILGYSPEELVNRNGFEYVHPDDRERLQSSLLTSTDSSFWHLPCEFRFRHRNGDWRLIESRGRIVRPEPGRELVVLNSRDITESRALAEQLRQAQKMETVGRLAGGVAHDFNNLLSIILLNLEFLRTDGPLSSVQAESAAEIGKAAERAANLTKQLLLFSRKQTPRFAEIDLNASLNNVGKMLRRVLGEDVELRLDLLSDPAPVHADEGMIDQVLLNLAVNARDAMPQGGKLSVKLERFPIASRPGERIIQARQGPFARISVADTGVGIAPEVLPRIFEPFFTTKDVGKGTGLGLSIVFGIIEQHQGWIEVQSEPGRGATFHIYLPLLGQAGSSRGNLPARQTLPRGSENIFVVEDDEALRKIAVGLLNRLGYSVTQAASAAHALELWQEAGPKIDLLLTDIVMPDGFNGKELAAQLLQQRPELKVIYMSGYSAGTSGPQFDLQAGVNFLPKPFAIADLASIIRSTLDRK